jgi:hypothetical protein
MAYNLPPPWDPGFALPKNVRDEGLQRRGLVTKWLPRGTYDDSVDGTAGYNVPQYIKDEGTGQGAFTTFWQGRGTYNGGKVPHWLNQRPTVTQVTPLPGGGKQFTVQPPLGDDAPIGEPFDTYGQKAAATLIASVAGLPPGQRQKVLKAAMDHIDKSLWSRTQDIFNRYVQQKMAPGNAFPLALARALSTGIAAEIITTGVRRVAPQANSLLGLGCYGGHAFPGAMGDVAWPTGCTPAPAGYTWLYSATVNGQSVPGHWAKLPPGMTAQPFCSGVVPPGALTVADPLTPGAPPPVIEVRDHGADYDWFVGPFGFNTSTFVPRVWAIGTSSATVANRASTPDIMYLMPGDLPAGPQLANVRPMIPQVLAWLKARLTEAKDASGNADTPTTYLDMASNRHPSSYMFDANGNVSQGQADDAKTWFDAMGIDPGTAVRLHTLWNLKTAGSPLARTTHIKTGANMALVVALAPMDLTRGEWSKANPLVLKVWLSTVPDINIFGALWNPMILINPLTALQATASVLAGVAPILGDLACDVLTNPAAGTVAGAAAAAYGIPPQAGTTGVALAASQCGKAPPPPPPPVVGHSIWPWVLLGGGAIVAVALLTKPKPKKATP